MKMQNFITEIESLLDMEFPETIQLDGCATIFDVRRFIQSHLDVLKGDSKKEIMEVHRERLEKVHSIITKGYEVHEPEIEKEKVIEEAEPEQNETHEPDIDFSGISDTQPSGMMRNDNFDNEKKVHEKFEPPIEQKEEEPKQEIKETENEIESIENQLSLF